MLSSHNRHLQVSSDVHTVLQFRMVDFSMESCALALRLPPLPVDDTVPRPYVLGDKVARSASGCVQVQLVTPAECQRSLFCDTSVMSQARWHPRCEGGGRGPAAEFPYSWASLNTYEISCAPESPQCTLHIWSNENSAWETI